MNLTMLRNGQSSGTALPRKTVFQDQRFHLWGEELTHGFF
jgi:hypothetical protein